jgi:hypothetical protein
MAKPIRPKKPIVVKAAPKPETDATLTMSAVDARVLLDAQAARAELKRSDPIAITQPTTAPPAVALPTVAVAAVAPVPGVARPLPVEPVVAVNTSALIAENFALSTARDAALKDNEQAFASAQRALAQLRSAETDVAARSDQLTKLGATLAATQQELTAARAEIKQLQMTRSAVDGPTVLTSDSVANLLSEFVGRFDGKIGALVLGASEVTLKVGFTAVDGKAAFVLPSATAPHEANQVLHDIKLQLMPRG